MELAKHIVEHEALGVPTETPDLSAYVETADLPTVVPDNETDPVFSASEAAKIGNDDVDFGDHKITAQDIVVKRTFQNYNPDLKDMGVEQINDKRGYGVDYIAEKLLAYCKIGGSANAEEGAIRDNAGTFQIYLSGAWRDVVTGFRFREDSNGDYELEHKPIGFNLWLEVNSGNSDLLGLNGLPLVQNYSVSMGAFPVALQLDGGVFN